MISNTKYRSIVKSMPVEKQWETIDRDLRVLPHLLMEEVARIPVLPNTDKVIKKLESRLKCTRLMKSSLLAHGRVV